MATMPELITEAREWATAEWHRLPALVRADVECTRIEIQNAAQGRYDGTLLTIAVATAANLAWQQRINNSHRILSALQAQNGVA